MNCAPSRCEPPSIGSGCDGPRATETGPYSIEMLHGSIFSRPSALCVFHDFVQGAAAPQIESAMPGSIRPVPGSQAERPPSDSSSRWSTASINHTVSKSKLWLLSQTTHIFCRLRRLSDHRSKALDWLEDNDSNLDWQSQSPEGQRWGLGDTADPARYKNSGNRLPASGRAGSSRDAERYSNDQLCW